MAEGTQNNSWVESYLEALVRILPSGYPDGYSVYSWDRRLHSTECPVRCYLEANDSVFNHLHGSKGLFTRIGLLST